VCKSHGDKGKNQCIHFGILNFDSHMTAVGKAWGGGVGGGAEGKEKKKKKKKKKKKAGGGDPVGVLSIGESRPGRGGGLGRKNEVVTNQGGTT